MLRRRAIFASLVVGSAGAALGVLAMVLGGDGLGIADTLMLLSFALTLPWAMIGFWNAVIGFLLQFRYGSDTARIVCPPAAIPAGSTAPTAGTGGRTAILMLVHEEDPDRVHASLVRMAADLAARAERPGRFVFFVASDTQDPAVAGREAALFGTWNERRPAGADAPPLHYRRRASNAGHKTGNLWDWLERHGAHFDTFVPLDADSMMSARALERLATIMDRAPEVGILQPLIAGLPNTAPFARIFQFGMRHGMRAYATGGAWWQGDSGPFWGHNAIVRTAPFMAHCRLPRLPGGPPLGGLVLSHDQVEAAVMRAAGHAVYVLPDSDGSFEENPPTLQDFIKRDLRWCQGNMQYLRLWHRPGFAPMGRLQLVLAIMMYVAAPAWLGFVGIGLGQAAMAGTGGASAPLSPIGWTLGIGLFAVMMGINLMPKIAGIAALLAHPARRRAHGGTRRVVGSAAIELVFSLFLGPIVAVAQTVFLCGLTLGRTVGWDAQRRTLRELGWGEAWRGLWPQTVIGCALFVLLAARAPVLLPWAAPILLPLMAAVPFARLTGRAWLGRLLVDHRLCATPEELRTNPATRPLRHHGTAPGPITAGKKAA